MSLIGVQKPRECCSLKYWSVPSDIPFPAGLHSLKAVIKSLLMYTQTYHGSGQHTSVMNSHTDHMPAHSVMISPCRGKNGGWAGVGRLGLEICLAALAMYHSSLGYLAARWKYALCCGAHNSQTPFQLTGWLTVNPLNVLLSMHIAIQTIDQQGSSIL